jgi:hypothetical protein
MSILPWGGDGGDWRPVIHDIDVARRESAIIDTRYQCRITDDRNARGVV